MVFFNKDPKKHKSFLILDLRNRLESFQHRNDTVEYALGNLF